MATAIDDALRDEIELLLKYDLRNSQAGLKVHSTAEPKIIAAAKRLHGKKLIDHSDGGFLTPLGYETAEHLQAAHLILTVPPSV